MCEQSIHTCQTLFGVSNDILSKSKVLLENYSAILSPHASDSSAKYVCTHERTNDQRQEAQAEFLNTSVAATFFFNWLRSDI